MKYLFSLILYCCGKLVIANTASSSLSQEELNNTIPDKIHLHDFKPANHSNECARMGGIDISNEAKLLVSSNVTDAYMCEITNQTQYQTYLKSQHKTLQLNATVNASAIAKITAVGDGGYFPDGKVDYSDTIEALFSNGNFPYDNYFPGISFDLYNTKDNISICHANGYGTALDNHEKNRPLTMHVSCKNIPQRSKVIISAIALRSVAVQSYPSFSEVHDRVEFMIFYPDGNLEIVPEKLVGYPDTSQYFNLPQTFIANPINLATGNNFVHEIDIPHDNSHGLSFERYYNSVDGLWRHNYSMHLQDANLARKRIVAADGQTNHFYIQDGSIIASPTELGHLKKLSDGYQFTSDQNEIYYFNAQGQIKSINTNGYVINIKHISPYELLVSDNFANALTITLDKLYQPIAVKSSNGTTISYEYDSKNRLVKMNQEGLTKVYQYSTANPFKLERITDSNGVLLKAWQYDNQGRAILSEQFAHNDKVNISYNSDGETTVTNAFNNKCIYQFKIIDGIKFITARTCSNPNSQTTYEYNSHGQIVAKTDGNSIRTRYSYSPTGLESSRIIATDTPNTLTITTTWDEHCSQPQTITYPDKIVHNDYDNNCNLISQNIQNKN